MSNLVKHAETELNLIGLTDEDDYNSAMRKHILHMIKEFADEGHSGFSGAYAIQILTKLMDFKPLTPLTGEDSEWTDVSSYGDGTNMRWQNNRHSSVFKDADGSCYDIDGIVFWEWFRDLETGKAIKTYYTASDSRVPVTFPYTVPDKPIYQYRQPGDSDEIALQNENGFFR
jgi:hypothetical protein